MNKYISDSRGILAIPLMAMFSSPVVPNIADVLSEKNGGIVIEDDITGGDFQEDYSLETEKIPVN